VRARRRVKELEEKGMPASYEEVLSDMIKRDEQDRSRDIAPAIAAPDAIHFDNSYEGFDEALEALLTVIRNAL
jgi:cytidylate kinase